MDDFLKAVAQGKIEDAKTIIKQKLNNKYETIKANRRNEIGKQFAGKE